MSERKFDQGIRDSIGHEIPGTKLDRRTEEIKEIFELFKENPIVILTSEGNSWGKSTFGKILRHKINFEENDSEFSDCLFINTNSISLNTGRPLREGRYNPHDDYTYPQLLRFEGLIILDNVCPDQAPIVTGLKKSKFLLITHPEFLEGPFDDDPHKDFVNWVSEENIPVYKLNPFVKRADAIPWPLVDL